MASFSSEDVEKVVAGTEALRIDDVITTTLEEGEVKTENPSISLTVHEEQSKPESHAPTSSSEVEHKKETPAAVPEEESKPESHAPSSSSEEEHKKETPAAVPEKESKPESHAPSSSSEVEHKKETPAAVSSASLTIPEKESKPDSHAPSSSPIKSKPHLVGDEVPATPNTKRSMREGQFGHLTPTQEEALEHFQLQAKPRSELFMMNYLTHP